MPAGQEHNRPCPVRHYSLPAQCTQLAGHDETWHTTDHPDNGQTLRFRTVLGARHTQEWQPDDDPEAAGGGEWVTWHYVTEADPTPVVPADLDRRAASLVAGHFPTGHVRSGQDGTESECGCDTWYPIGGESAHLGREVSLLARGYFDLALRYSQERTQLAN
ncbi:hypothetical protein ACFXKF_32960 [Streptomyces scopuliridis]|uniref:hypothetical protein n=1 Tax=Streptomyces scopuliridis TaxID=452529 RepID=UPI0036818D2F